MATRSKEEDLLLDQKIAQIRKKNEEILKRAKEVEEDKKLAMEQNALVQLRPANIDDSRERTPALRPSAREFNKGTNEIGDFHETNSRHPEVPNFRGRGARGGYNRDRNDRKDGPPPDPRSFLADSERDPPTPRDGRGKTFTRVEESQRGNREFQRGGRRGGERGRGGGRGDRMYHRETREDAWRAERLRIDEARIQRQKTADGKWRREWDTDKIHEELNDDAKIGRGRGDARPAEQWKHSTHANTSLHTNFDYNHGRGGGSFRGGRGGRGGNSYYADRGSTADDYVGHDMQRSHNNTSGSNDFDNFKGRGGGRPALQNKNSTPVLRRTVPNSPTSGRNDKSAQDVDETEIVVDSSKGQHRSVKNVGASLEVSISNVQDERHNDRFTKDRRHGGRFSRQGKNSRSSYSSQSEDEMPKEKGFGKTKRDRIHIKNKQSCIAPSHTANENAEHNPSKNFEENIQSGEAEGNHGQGNEKDVEGSEQLTGIEDFGINIPINQNPLPPFKAMPEIPKKSEADVSEPELSEGDNRKAITVTTKLESSFTGNNVQTLESNSEQGLTETNIAIPAEQKLSSVENNAVEPKGSNDKINSTLNSGIVKECDQISPTDATMKKFIESVDQDSEKANTEIVATEVNVENKQVGITKSQENELKVKCPVTTEKTVGEDVISETKSEDKMSSEIKSDPKASCDDSDTKEMLQVGQTDTEIKETLSENKQQNPKASCDDSDTNEMLQVGQTDTEIKETLSENKQQNTVNITESVAANEDIKSVE